MEIKEDYVLVVEHKATTVAEVHMPWDECKWPEGASFCVCGHLIEHHETDLLDELSFTSVTLKTITYIYCKVEGCGD